MMKAKSIFLFLLISFITQFVYSNEYEDALKHVQDGDRLYKTNLPDKALKKYDKALELNDGRGYAAYVHYQKAMIYLKLGDDLKATQEIRESLALYPKVDYTVVYKSYDRQREARDFMQKLIYLSTKNENKLKDKIYAKLDKLIANKDNAKLLQLLTFLEKM